MIHSEYELTLSRTLNASVAQIWHAWSIAEHFEKWWTPAPVKTKVTKLDLVPGGAFDTIIQMPDGASHQANGSFLNVVENRVIVFTDALQEGWVPSGAGFMTVFIMLTPQETAFENQETTQYDVRIAHKNAEDKQRHIDMGFYEGWNITLSQLEQVAQTLDAGA